jgi:competence protein ComEC
VVFGGIRFARVSRVALLALGFLSVVVGIGLVPAGLHIAGWWWHVLTACAFILCGKRRLVVAVPAVIIAGLVVGMWRGSQQIAELASYKAFIGQKVVVQGNVAEDPTYDDDHQQVMLLEQVIVNGRALPGKVRVKSLAPVEPARGDRVQAGGKLYDGFGNYQASLYYADLIVVQSADSPIDHLRRAFAARVFSLLPDTEAGLGLGFLLGIKSSLPDDLNNELKLLGLTHIVVASGYNLTVLVRLARRLFASTSHYVMTVTSSAMIIGFVGVTGFSPSMSRAALVAGLSVLAWYYGRRIHPALLITLAAAITGLINPLYVWSDIGWWLSFLAFAGVMLLAPLLQRRIFAYKEPKLLWQIAIETICAQVVTMPLIMLIFGTFSVLSLPANILVVPLIPLAMLFVFAAGAIGAIVPFVAWPAIWLLQYIGALVQLLASVGWASVPLVISVPIFVVCYVAIAMVGLVLRAKTKHDYLSKSVIE